jgi:hypothetical protein
MFFDPNASEYAFISVLKDYMCEFLEKWVKINLLEARLKTSSATRPMLPSRIVPMSLLLAVLVAEGKGEPSEVFGNGNFRPPWF